MTLDTPRTNQPQTQYEHEFVNQMNDIDAIIETTTNPLHRKILINYRRHGLLEVSGRYDEILGEDMTSRHPHYRIIEGGETAIIDGLENVRNFYKTLADVDMLVMWTGKQKMAVADWGFAGEAEFSQFVPGSMLGDNVFSSLETDADDAPESEYEQDAYYLVRRKLAFFWPYDENGLLCGEHVYEDPATKVITKVEHHEVISGERAAELLAHLIDKYELPA